MDLEQISIGLGKVLLDPVRLQQQTKYKTSGLTVTSNNENIMPRDAAGNIIFHESSSQNPLLIIEPVDTKIMLRSVLKVLDTRFEYFKFPVTIVSSEVEDLAVDLNIESPDIVYARYKPSENRKLGYTGESDKPASQRASGILMDEVVEGTPQTNVNSYYVTKEVKDSGVNLRFRAKINHSFVTPEYSAEQIAYAQQQLSDPNSLPSISGKTIQDLIPGYIPKSNIWFFISIQGPNKPLDRAIIGPFSGFSSVYPDEWSSIASGETKNTFIDAVIPNDQFEAGDYFGITQINVNGMVTETDPVYHIINSEQTYWTITDASKNVDDWNREIE